MARDRRRSSPGSFRRICSWCGNEALGMSAPTGRSDVRPENFGICPRCLEKLIQALPRLRNVPQGTVD